MILRGLVLLFALTAGLAQPQSNPALDIHGVVTEVGLNLGVAGAEVTLYEFVHAADRFRDIFATGATDSRGAFQFHPVRFGDYYVEVKKQGYVATTSWDGPGGALREETGTPITVSAEHPTQEVRLALMRPSELTGHVIDDDGKPVARLMVQVVPAGSDGLTRQLAMTDREGSFTVNKLIPGEYVVKGSSVSSEGVTAVATFTEDDLKVVDQNLETDERSPTTVRVSPGAPTNLGTVRVHTTPSYRARVSIAGCQPDDRPGFGVGGQAFVLTGDFSSFTPFTLPSCQDFLVKGLKLGSYSFALNSKRGWAAAAVEVTNRNVEVTLRMSPVVDVPGRIVAEEGATLPPFDKLRVLGGSESAVDAKGAFLLRGLRGPSRRISLVGLGNNFYIQEFRVDGRVAANGVVVPHQGIQLEIVLDDKPAAITGSVTDGDRPFSQPLVFVAKWPTLEVMNSRITGDNEGRFRVSGFAPGEYRVLAVQSAALPDGQQINPQMLSKLWSSAEKVKLERGGSQSVALKLSDPMR